MNEFLDIFMEAGVDTLKLIPFLFLTYVLMEWLEHRTGSHTQAAILRAGKAGPVFGGILGIVPVSYTHLMMPLSKSCSRF